MRERRPGDPTLAEDVAARYPAPEVVIALADQAGATGHVTLADQWTWSGAMQSLAGVANGVNIDLSLALFDADHGDPAGALGRTRRMGAAPQHPRRRRVRLGAVRERSIRAGVGVRRLALALGTRNALFLFHAGMIRLELGDRDAARRDLACALEINPNFSIQYATEGAKMLAELEAER